MPINDGDIHFVTRNLARNAQESIDAAVRETIEAEKRREALARMSTDLSYRTWHTERWGPSLDGAERFAAGVFEIPRLTRTPVDTWMARLRGLTVA